MITLFSKNFVVVARLEVVPPLRAKQKPPQDCEGFQKNWYENLLIRCVQLTYFVPIDNIKECSNVIWASILIIQVVSVLPNI